MDYTFDDLVANKMEAYKARSKEKGRSFELTFQEFKEMVLQPCSYCGASAATSTTYEFNGAKGTMNGIDRINNDKGYELANCVPCCTYCNFTKREMSLDIWLRWVRRVAAVFEGANIGDVPLDEDAKFLNRKIIAKSKLLGNFQKWKREAAYKRGRRDC
jgi:hypothetical protein